MQDEATYSIGPEAQLPAVVARNARRVRFGFWPKFKRVVGRIPFAHDLAAAWFCAIDPATPLRVRATLLAALAYFVLPADAVPDFLLSVGFTDDASVLIGALTIVAAHIRPEHRTAAAEALKKLET